MLSSGYESSSTSSSSNSPGIHGSTASTSQIFPSNSLFGDGISLMSSGSQVLPSVLPSATTTPEFQGSPLKSPNTLPLSFVSIFAPVPTVSDGLLPTYSFTTETPPFSSAAVDSFSALLSEVSTVSDQLPTLATVVVTVTVTEIATLVSGRVYIASTALQFASSSSTSSTTNTNQEYQRQQQWLQDTIDSFINWLKSVLHMT